MAADRFRRAAVAIAMAVGLMGLAAAGGLLWLKNAPRETPAGQPPLATLEAASLESLRAEFNRHPEEVRVLVLLSPT